MKNFEESESSRDYLKFIGSSTKFKIITTKFEGYAKEFTVTYDKKGANISNVVISITANQLDTDSSSRNEKMFSKCLEIDKYPNITGKLDKTILIGNNASGEAEISLTIKDKVLVRNLKYNFLEKDGKFQIHFTTDFSFIEAGIADPSIVIAKVAEIFQIEGNITLE